MVEAGGGSMVTGWNQTPKPGMRFSLAERRPMIFGLSFVAMKLGAIRHD
jgi:hypothetical protein